jgi:arylsulfatase A-like enzyme
VDTYDYGVLRADQVIARILRLLQEKGYLDEALVALTADHGEALGEHGLYNHTDNVYEEVLRIPFMLLTYGRGPRLPIDRPGFAGQIDIAPTLLAELGLPSPKTWVGEPLHRGLSRRRSFFQQQDQVGLFDHGDPQNLWKYWKNLRTGEELVFNLSTDPGELHNLVDQVSPTRLKDWRATALPAASSGAAAD